MLVNNGDRATAAAVFGSAVNKLPLPACSLFGRLLATASAHFHSFARADIRFRQRDITFHVLRAMAVASFPEAVVLLLNLRSFILFVE